MFHIPSSGMTIRVSSRLAKVKCFKSTFILESFFLFSFLWVQFWSFNKKEVLKIVESRKRKKVTVTRIFPDSVRVGRLPSVNGMLLLMAEQWFSFCSGEFAILYGWDSFKTCVLALLMFYCNCTWSPILFQPSLAGNVTGLYLCQILSLICFVFKGKDQGELVLWACNPAGC